MADVDNRKPRVMLVLHHPLWCRLLPLFSDRAKVTGFFAAWLAVPHSGDESVHTFIWPVPVQGACVTVEEPDTSFLSRVSNAGISLSDPGERTAAPQLLANFEDEPDPTDPGSFAAHKTCPHCTEENLWVEGEGVSSEFIAAYVTSHKVSLAERRRLLVLRCANCLEVFLQTSSGLVHYSIEVA